MSDTQAVTILKSLADETRLSIVRKLAHSNCEAPTSDIAGECAKLSQPAMSHHFAKLVQAGVLIERKTGTEKNYELNRELLERVGIDADKL